MILLILTFSIIYTAYFAIYIRRMKKIDKKTCVEILAALLTIAMCIFITNEIAVKESTTIKDKAEPFEKLMLIVESKEIRNFRLYDRVRTNAPELREDKFIIPSELEASGLCNIEPTSYEDEVICYDFKWFKKSMEYVDSYKYTPSCLIELEMRRYEAFVTCSDAEVPTIEVETENESIKNIERLIKTKAKSD